MKPPPFDYIRARSVSQALDALRDYGDEAKAVAGGQSLVPLLNLRLARPSVLVDINDVEADDLMVADGNVVTGALVRHRQLCTDPAVASAHPLLAHAAAYIGHTAIRNRGTVGGSLAHADATAELPLVAVACKARIVAASADAVREIPAEELFLGPFMTALAPDELVLTVQWPVLGAQDSWGFAEVAERSGDFAMAAAAVHVAVGESGARHPVVAVTGVSGKPQRLAAAEQVLGQAGWSARELVDAVAEEVTDATDSHRRHLAGEMVLRAATEDREREDEQ